MLQSSGVSEFRVPFGVFQKKGQKDNHYFAAALFEDTPNVQGRDPDRAQFVPPRGGNSSPKGKDDHFVNQFLGNNDACAQGMSLKDVQSWA